MKTDLVMKALSQAREQRNLIEGKTIIHSDRGCQFTSHDWHRMLKQLCLIGSMSHTGNCYDNATMERFFGSLKDALIVDEAVVDANTMKANIDHWIVKYNYQRVHSALGYLTPVQFEKEQVVKVA